MQNFNYLNGTSSCMVSGTVTVFLKGAVGIEGAVLGMEGLSLPSVFVAGAGSFDLMGDAARYIWDGIL